MVSSPWSAMLFAWVPFGIVYLLFVVPPLFFLRARVLDDVTRAIWALAIISVPIMGAVAFVIIQPGQREG